MQGQIYPTSWLPMEVLGDKHAQEEVVRARRVCWVARVWGRKRQLTPVFLPEESHGQRNLGDSQRHQNVLSQRHLKFKPKFIILIYSFVQ